MEEEKVLDSFEVLYNNVKGNMYITNRFLIYISETTKKEKDEDNSLFLMNDIDLKICIFSWKKTEKSKKKNKIRFTFARTDRKNNFCFHDYNSTDSYIFEFFNEKNYNDISDMINSLNKDNLRNHLFVDFNLNLIKNDYRIYETNEDGNDNNDNNKLDKNNMNELLNVHDNFHTNKIAGDDLLNVLSSHESLKENEKKMKRRKKGELDKNNIIIEDDSNHNEDSSNDNNESDDNVNDFYNSLNRMFEIDRDFKKLYDMCIENNILNDEEFYKLHKNQLYEYKNISYCEDMNILKEPIYISEEQKLSKSVEINNELRKLILCENKELKKLYDYYIENNILSDSKFWFFLFNNKYSHLFFYDKNEKDPTSNKHVLNIKEDKLFESLSYNLENLNQDIKGTLEKCILKEYLTHKTSNKKNVLFKNNYYFNEENMEGFGVFTNEKLIKNYNNSYNLLINKFNNYCIGMIKDNKYTLDKFYDDLKEKIDDTDLNIIDENKAQQFNLEKIKTNICDEETLKEEITQNEKYVNDHFDKFMDDLRANKHTSKKNYADLYNIGRVLFVLNTKRCQSNQSLLIGTIEYEQHILNIVKEYHIKINYLLNLFYTSYIPEENKRNNILENLSRIKDEIQAKQEEYNSVLIMGKPLLIHLFEQIAICKKFNEKLNKYIQEKRKKA
ncbi:hypothetical protein PFNF135_00656 [Plasmodium falciparum NF135/5.C10]|uniref:BSD domain-containing protein n=1 Tax=Plasmodium falciparum NF135/5.C10 TaxID=1036726 RepID=W4IPI8_PLAFA|nr:hypothetical protein PFNF135_00656 [Plasmodium falciparum NF135/5.C10]